jgi:DtxR family transcriptional regulator, Mn-dependent transcriptional regulator
MELAHPVHAPTTQALSGALEDYLKTILALVRDHGFARVRDIATARQVKAGSVTPALRRLADLGLITYSQREYIGLTQTGETEARRVVARHTLLTRFFTDVLRMAPEAAAQEACSMEHSLSPEAMDRFTRLFEYLQVCRMNEQTWLDRFHSCSLVHEGLGLTGGPVCDGGGECRRREQALPLLALSKLKPGQGGRVRQIDAKGTTRQRLLDMGLLPDAVVNVERLAPTGDPVWISLDGSHIALRRSEAASVLVTRA